MSADRLVDLLTGAAIATLAAPFPPLARLAVVLGGAFGLVAWERWR